MKSKNVNESNDDVDSELEVAVKKGNLELR
jgi:hypothetical protein